MGNYVKVTIVYHSNFLVQNERTPMIRLDTTKIKISRHQVEINESLFELTKTDHRSNKSTYNLIKRPIGVSFINYDDENVIIEFSAKILKQDYFDLITFDNFVILEDVLEDNQIMRFKNIDAYVDAVALRTDNTHNYKMNQSRDIKTTSELTHLLTMVKPPKNKYQALPYDQKNNTGIDIRNVLKTGTRRLICYDKEKDLIHGNGRDIRPYVDIQEFKNTARFEANITSFKNMRRYFDIKNNTLGNILQAKQTPVKLLFDEYTGNFMSSNKIDIRTNLSLSQTQKRLGMKQQLEAFNYDIDAIKSYLLLNGLTTRNNVSHAIKPYIALKTELLGATRGETNKEYKELLQDISNELQQALE